MSSATTPGPHGSLVRFDGAILPREGTAMQGWFFIMLIPPVFVTFWSVHLGLRTLLWAFFGHRFAIACPTPPLRSGFYVPESRGEWMKKLDKRFIAELSRQCHAAETKTPGVDLSLNRARYEFALFVAVLRQYGYIDTHGPRAGELVRSIAEMLIASGRTPRNEATGELAYAIEATPIAVQDRVPRTEAEVGKAVAALVVDHWAHDVAEGRIDIWAAIAETDPEKQREILKGSASDREPHLL